MLLMAPRMQSFSLSINLPSGSRCPLKVKHSSILSLTSVLRQSEHFYLIGIIFAVLIRTTCLVGSGGAVVVPASLIVSGVTTFSSVD